MTMLCKLIDEGIARWIAEKFILDRYPYANVTFERAELRNNDTKQFYRFSGYSRLAKWPESIAPKTLCEVYIDAQSADIIGSNGL